MMEFGHEADPSEDADRSQQYDSTRGSQDPVDDQPLEGEPLEDEPFEKESLGKGPEFERLKSGLILPKPHIISPEEAQTHFRDQMILNFGRILSDLREVFHKVWALEFAQPREGWSDDIPWWGQTDLTALVLQETFFSGSLARTELTTPGDWKVTHYLNVVSDGPFDFLAAELPSGFEVKDCVPDTMDSVTTRGYLLMDDERSFRYRWFRERFREALHAA